MPCPKISEHEAAQVVLYHNSIILGAIEAEAGQCLVPALSGTIPAELNMVYEAGREVSFDLLKSVQAVVDYLGRQSGQLTGAGPRVATPRDPLDARPGRGPLEPQPGRVRAS